ncbi:hypothetical protein ACFL33_01400 [Pseudomonadota bacterium]|jgi:uncharacterized membrane protein|nr:hypothetical protein [Xanthomonadales bacterium]
MLGFLKKALLRGLVILIPVVLIYLTIRELVELMIGFATPLADLIAADWILEDDPVELIALVLILLVAMALGLIWSVGPTRRAVEWLETRTLYQVPMYRMVKSLVAAFLDLEGEDSFQPASWRHGDGSLEPVFIIEEHGEDMFVVLQPWTPTPFAGSIRVVPRSQVEFVPVTLDEYSLALTHYGLDLSQALQKRGSAKG